MKKIEMKEKGITLIALVITIIVLLILAGVTIATLTGDNGILTKASEAKEKTEEAKEEELRKLTQAEAATHLENSTHTDKSTGKEETVTIPAGFAVSQVEGENTINEGLVIIDQNGNEFVWVPVNYDIESDNFNEVFIRREGYRSGIEQTFLINCGETNGSGINNKYEESLTTQEEARKMYESVKRNRGFYVGRYEAGKLKDKVVIKKGVDTYNGVTWSRNGQMNEEDTELAEGIDGIQDGAIELSRNFDTENNYTNVTSTLIYSVQWDAIMQWMKDIPNSNIERTLYIQDSTGMGYYEEDIPSKTGYYSVKNIYDLAGNIYEWTMECYNSQTRITRGGNFSQTTGGFKHPASERGSNYPYENDKIFGFRIALFLK